METEELSGEFRSKPGIATNESKGWHWSNNELKVGETKVACNIRKKIYVMGIVRWVY